MKLRFPLLTASAALLQLSLHAQERAKKQDAPRIVVSPSNPSQPSLAEPPDKVTPAGGVPEGIAQIVAVFFGSLQRGDVDPAYNVLTKGSKIAEKPEELKQLKAKTQEALDVFGTIAGYDLVEAKSVGNRLVRATYASHGKVYPLRWRFYFYKPEDVWRLIDMRVDDKLSGMFDEPDDSKNSGIKP